MSTKLIEAIEAPLKKGITQKDGVGDVVSKISEAKRMAEQAYGHDSKPALLLNKAEMCFRRSHSEAERAVRNMANAIGFIDENADLADQAQRNIFDEGDDVDEPAADAPVPLQLNGTVSPPIEAERLVPGGDAHDSISVPQLAGATRDDLAVLRGYFEVDGKLYVAIALAPDRYCEAHELLFADDVDEDELVFKAKGGYQGQHALLDYKGDDQLDEVILGERIRFVVMPEPAEEDEGVDQVSGDGAAEDHVEPEPAAA